MIALCTFTQICLGVTNTCSTFFRADLVVAVGAGMAGNADTFVEIVTSSVGPRTMIWTLQRKINVFKCRTFKQVYESPITFNSFAYCVP